MRKSTKQDLLNSASDYIDPQTGEIMEGKLNQVVYVETRRPDGSLRIQQDFRFCPTMAEQHTAHLTNLNYLVEKFKPDELAAYIEARNQYRREIEGHDFSREPNLQEAKNIVYQSRQEFEKLPDEIKMQFKSHLEFLKFVDNPSNEQTLIKLGLITQAQVDKIKIPENPALSQQNLSKQNESKATTLEDTNDSKSK